MKDTLRRLWQGKITPWESFGKTAEYQKRFRRLLKEEEKLFQQLDADGKELFERCDKLRSSLDSAGEEEVFILGFRLGVRLLLEALCED